MPYTEGSGGGWDIVTGGCGFLGRRLVHALAAEGRQVAVVDDGSTPGADRMPDGALRHEHGDLTDDPHILGNYTGYLANDPVRAIWHLASPASPRAYKARQVTTLRLGSAVLDDLLGLAVQRGARLLFASSSEVYGDPVSDRQREDEPSRIHPTGPRSCYDAAKVFGEAMCAAWHHERNADVRIVRPFNTYGPGMYPADGRLVSSLVYAALTDTPFMVHGDGTQTRTLGYVDDTVAGFQLVMASDLRATPVNVGGERTISVVGLAQLVRAEIGRFPLLFGPPQDEHDPRRRRPDLIRLRSLGWSPRTGIVEGIHATAEWMRTVL